MSQVHIRRAQIEDAPALARINTESWQRTYRGIIPGAYLDAIDMSQRERAVHERLIREAADAGTLAATLVVEDDQRRVIAYVSMGAARPMQSGEAPAGYDAEVYALFTAPGYERRGLGSQLLHASASHLRNRGATSLIIWALKENPNVGFYLALGGVIAYEQTITIGGAALEEVGFGWPDLDTLIARPAER